VERADADRRRADRCVGEDCRDAERLGRNAARVVRSHTTIHHTAGPGGVKASARPTYVWECRRGFIKVPLRIRDGKSTLRIAILRVETGGWNGNCGGECRRVSGAGAEGAPDGRAHQERT